jgi:hypothetical protein
MTPVDPGAVDPVSWAAASLLGMEASKAAAGEAGRRVWVGMERLGGLVRRKLTGDEEGQAALTMVCARPDDQTRIGLLAEILQALAADDPTFKSALAELVREAHQAGAVKITATNSGIAAGGNVTLRGRNVAGRDQQVSSGPDSARR